MTGEQFITQKMIQKFRAWGRDGNYPGTPNLKAIDYQHFWKGLNNYDLQKKTSRD